MLIMLCCGENQSSYELQLHVVTRLYTVRVSELFTQLRRQYFFKETKMFIFYTAL